MQLTRMKATASAVINKLNRDAKTPVAVIVNTGDANSYGAVSNLGRAGIPVIAVSSEPNNITFASRYTKALLCPDHRESEAPFIEFLIHIGAALATKPVLFVNGDDQLLVLLRHEAQIAALFHLPYAPYDKARRLVNKVEFYQLLSEIDAPHAATYIPRDAAEMNEIADQLQYPYILKPSQSSSFSQRFGNKCLHVLNPDEARARFTEIARFENRIILQKQILGTERYLVSTYFSKQSHPLAVCCYRKVRIYPTDFGNATTCETCHEEDAIALCLDVLGRIEYCGLAEAEIQRDQCDGQLKIVEINARSTTEDRLPAYCGINMELLAYHDVLGQTTDTTCRVNDQLGVLWIDLYRDILAVFSSHGYRTQGKLSARKWGRSFLGKRRVFAYWALDDPMPALRLWLRLLRLHVLNKKRIHQLLSFAVGRARVQ